MGIVERAMSEKLILLGDENERLRAEVDRRFGIQGELVAARAERDRLRELLLETKPYVRDKFPRLYERIEAELGGED